MSIDLGYRPRAVTYPGPYRRLL